ncbi:MAG: hypothetical protein KDB03_03585 [Planctomycetales bacterium]|nr:hypothetical protein [Planctomycetales bacterium]
MDRYLILLMVLAGIARPLLAQDWSAEDETFDPSIHSVVIGERSWIGDPSPFVHVDSARTGYTHVHATDYEGMAPAVQLSLMLPLLAGESEPPGGGMMLLNKEQTEVFMKAWSTAISRNPDQKPESISLKTSMSDAQWVLKCGGEKGLNTCSLKTNFQRNCINIDFR